MKNKLSTIDNISDFKIVICLVYFILTLIFILMIIPSYFREKFDNESKDDFFDSLLNSNASMATTVIKSANDITYLQSDIEDLQTKVKQLEDKWNAI